VGLRLHAWNHGLRQFADYALLGCIKMACINFYSNIPPAGPYAHNANRSASHVRIENNGVLRHLGNVHAPSHYGDWLLIGMKPISCFRSH
jgi:hypothetical protein